ncbi:biotin-dependent carboxyltransferase family protein [Niallia circulans]|uniref:5-oxoprolinase subunit C family protein n=1 Tax=Niallia circulans TaxID=1397 RepID=UPI003979CB95
MEYIKCLKPGLLTTIQDLGRPSYQSFGVSVSGAMDPLSLKLANIIVGNPPDYAALEITLLGPEILFKGEGIIAVTGADLSPALNGKAIPMWRAIHIEDGAILKFGKGKNGCRSYLAILGGIDVPEVMGSKATFIRGRYGGIEGRALQSNDYIPIGPFHPKWMNEVKNRRIPGCYIPNFSNEVVRFVWGPHDREFEEESKEIFVTGFYQVTNQSDRMGYRLNGDPLVHKKSADILSEFAAPGTIQVPANGKPIILMADCQMSGGYTKIGMVIGTDIPLVAQKKPGDAIKFQPISILQAQQEWKRQMRWLSILAANNLHLSRKTAI